MGTNHGQISYKRKPRRSSFPPAHPSKRPQIWTAATPRAVAAASPPDPEERSLFLLEGSAPENATDYPRGSPAEASGTEPPPAGAMRDQKRRLYSAQCVFHDGEGIELVIEPKSSLCTWLKQGRRSIVSTSTSGHTNIRTVEVRPRADVTAIASECLLKSSQAKQTRLKMLSTSTYIARTK